MSFLGDIQMTLNSTALDAETVTLDTLIKAENASRRRIFFYTGSAQTFVVPDGVTKLFITACGGGGGSGNTSTAGGSTIIGSLVTLPGGGCGNKTTGGLAGGVGGGDGGRSADNNAKPGILGTGGAFGYKIISGTVTVISFGGGGSLGCGKSYRDVGMAIISTPASGVFGNYGGGGTSTSTSAYSGGGGGAAIWHKEYSVSPGDSISITVGTGGNGASGQATAGGEGIVIIEW